MDNNAWAVLLGWGLTQGGVLCGLYYGMSRPTSMYGLIRLRYPMIGGLIGAGMAVLLAWLVLS